MRNFILGFLTAYFIFTVGIFVKKSMAIGGGQTGNPDQDFETLFKDKQDKNFFVGQSTPAATSMNQGDIMFSTSSLKGWTRYQNDVYFFVLTKF